MAAAGSTVDLMEAAVTDFWKFFTGVSVAVVTYGVSYVGIKLAGANIFLAGLLAGGFAALTFYGLGHVLGYSTPEDMEH